MTLPGHSLCVLNAAKFLFGQVEEPTPLAINWLRFFGLPQHFSDNLLHNLFLAAVLHDIGKANADFQDALCRRGEQVFRHEHLSALLLWESPLKKWMGVNSRVSPKVVVAAIVSHHYKVNHQTFATPLLPMRGTSLFIDHPDFAATLRLAEPLLGPMPPLNALPRNYTPFANLEEVQGRFLADFGHFKRTLHEGEPPHRLLLAVKAALVAADAAGSGLWREGLAPEEWLSHCFGGTKLTATGVEEKVIGPRICEIEQRTGKPFHAHDFQDAAATVGPRALLLAGCGSGKTLAAWQWIQSQASQRPVSRAIFLYPTRATSTEGFRDYVSWAGGEEAALIHGTSAYDLEGLFSNPLDERRNEDYTVPDRLFALGYWPRKFFSATVDSFLGFMAHQYASACLLPVLAESVVVIDEIHSFSRSMFTALERFLKFFDIPILCMTATLTQDRLRILQDRCGLVVFPSDPSAFADLNAQEQAPRYLVQTAKQDGLADIIREALCKGQRVLWVANTVARCQKNAIGFRAWCTERGVPLRCYHSRFRLMDRRDRHEEVIALFREKTATGALVVTTQVCQMSLDLDADLVVTEFAPVPDLIQRMGRCCRVPHPGPRRGLIWAYAPDDAKPYDPVEMAQGESFLQTMAGKGEISQADTGTYLERMTINEPQLPDGYAGFLDAGWYAMTRDDAFRDSLDFSEDCVLDCDREAFLAARRASKPTDGFVVPVPKRFAIESSALGPRLKEAPGDHYRSDLGFLAEVSDA